MPESPRSSDSEGPGGTPLRACGRHCRCARSSHATNDLDTLLATPGFSGSLLGADVTAVAGRLPLLDQVVGVTVAGPVLMNAVGMHETPVGSGGAIRCRPSRITLRINPARLGSALITDPAAHIPPTLRLFDTDGNTAHATYLTERSDRLAFESLALGVGSADEERSVPDIGAFTTPEADRDAIGEAGTDQVAQFDAILDDGGAGRLTTFPGLRHSGHTRVESRRVIAALEHAALLGMPATLVTAAPGCLQMHHDQLDGAREHRGSMVIAGGTCRAMINFELVSECWVTWSDGVWGRTGSIELYDRHGRCSMVVTQTGPVSMAAFEAWNQLVTDVAD
ncbi:heme transporter [Gordonia sp. PKS22-38]|uniref:Heme transporter n=1 Tax=Gordonia prachuapensis TaxID=3115651 RepID=A0ABU7MQC6_9ACTN|nr:heme transporter [Gordonia sp. PKS22-38]